MRQPDKYTLNFISRWKRRVFSRPLLVRWVVVAIIVVTVFCLANYLVVSKINFAYELSNFQKTINTFLDPKSALTQTNQRTNILVLGQGGPGHQAPDLTDSMILFSIDLKTYKIWILPLPRDIWIPSIRAKLNTAYHYGKQQNQDKGFILSKAAVSEITDLPIHYAVLIDFNGFAELVDLLGGIDINVTNSFDDFKFPIPGRENAEPESDRYEHIRFEAGMQHMKGETALKYVRSRNSEGAEGTDLARSERQKLVILAIKDKLLTTNVIFNQKKLLDVKTTLGNNLVTDIDNSLIPAFVRLALNFHRGNLYPFALPVYIENTTDQASESALLINPPISLQYDNQWVLIPKNNNFNDIHQYIDCKLKSESDCLSL